MTRIFRGLTLAALVAAVGACAPVYRSHGYVPEPQQLQVLSVGVDTRETVETRVGRPTIRGFERGDAWYYVQSRRRNYGWRPPETIDRELVAISFAENGTLSNIERFGLERGQVVPLSRRVTTTTIRDYGLIQQLLRNFGRINVGEALANDR
ncbi:SmpA / OmlA family protein [Jannaschia seosinensis]|uniref:SmpA / OmlA family protein n=1 Tax=Jannaschia seosinensis TaxID=313367 RepID=A0A0M7BCY5_9RHOB|nr:outer membrane protein assembly factor BamE [Jannaschia seosinensis]CUH39684.1 SmpA / OmlA family protein [Jannaschia seosinensis]